MSTGLPDKNNPILKDPDAVLDYTIDWQPRDNPYLESDETISSSSWSASPSGIIDDGTEVSSPTNTNTTSTVWLVGGTVGTTYMVTNSISTDKNRKDDRSFYVQIKER